MSRHNDLGDRLDQALGARGRLAFDPTISRAMIERRRRYLSKRGGPEGGSDTASIQARLAAAREAKNENGSDETP